MRLFLSALMISAFAGQVAMADQFSVEEMPVGAEVTIPPTAKTTIPLGSRIKLTSTDNPQTIRLTPIGNGSTFASPIRVAIYDKHQDRVQYVNLAPNAPFLYSFKGLTSISIQPSQISGKTAKGVRMQIESDRALSVAR